MRQCRQRQGAAFAVIVGAHDDQDVLDRDHQDQRPEDQGQRAHHRDVVGNAALGRQHGGFQRVKRTGADIAEHDAQGAQRQAPLSSALGLALFRHVIDCRRGRGKGFGRKTDVGGAGCHGVMRLCMKGKRVPCILVCHLFVAGGAGPYACPPPGQRGARPNGAISRKYLIKLVYFAGQGENTGR